MGNGELLNTFTLKLSDFWWIGTVNTCSSTRGTSSDKYLALHKTATIGTIIFVKNQMNDNVVIVRVIGALPNTGINDKINIKLSRVAFEKLDAKDDIIPVELTYVKEEIKY